jgi:hypothetical protein
MMTQYSSTAASCVVCKEPATNSSGYSSHSTHGCVLQGPYFIYFPFLIFIWPEFVLFSNYFGKTFVRIRKMMKNNEKEQKGW